MLTNDTTPETTSVDMNLYLLPLHPFWGESIVRHGIVWHRCPKRDEVVCYLVTSVSLDWLCALGGLSNILWPRCPEALDADVVSWLRGEVSPALGSLVPWESLHKG